MVFNYAVELLFCLVGILHVVGCIGGLMALAALCWLQMSRRGANLRSRIRLDEEYRCRSCFMSDCCDAAYTGVSYPCSHFEEKKNKLD